MYAEKKQNAEVRTGNLDLEWSLPSTEGLRITPPATGTLVDTEGRKPVVIKGGGKKANGMFPPPKRRRYIVHLAVVAFLVLILGGTLVAVQSTGSEAKNTPRVSSNKPPSYYLTKHSETFKVLPEQEATVTAVVQMYSEPTVIPTGPETSTGGGGNPGGTIPPVEDSSGNHFYPGNCTWWAAQYYHRVNNVWIPWYGDAYEWVEGARAAGWHVSTTPVVGSIIVLMPGVQGAGSVGHVAYVEGVSGNVAHTSNMNWAANGGGFGIVSSYDFTAGDGVFFVYQ